MSMKTQVTRTVSSCFTALRQTRSICRSVSQPVLLSLVTSLVLSRLDYGIGTLISISFCIDSSVLNAAGRLVLDGRKYYRITSLLCELHWLRVSERIKFRLAVLVFRCRNNTAPAYLAKDLQWASDDNSRRRLQSASSHQLIARRSHRTIGDHTFSVAAPRPWNALPPDVISAPSLTVFKKLLKTHLFKQSFV